MGFHSAVYGISKSTLDFVPQAQALLFIRVDLVFPAGRDVLKPQHWSEQPIETDSTVFADVWARRVGDRVEVPATGAPLELPENGTILTEREDGFIDEVTRSLVVDHRTRPELRNR